MCCRRIPLLSYLLVSLLSVVIAAGCTPAHLNADGDGGVDPGRCGDFSVGGDELCDDGNTDDGDGCSADCQPEIPPNCNDTILDPDEQCDDGNNDAGDGCGPGCWIEACGNGHLDPGEACEDNNTESGDGCSSDCLSDETCGNGIKDIDEGCDDGDGDDTDECPASCEPAFCGDGFVRNGLETCDDGNDVPEDGCTNCILDSCGDGDMDPGEECDNGAANGSPGSTCFITCITTTVGMGDGIVHDIDVNDILGLEPTAVETGDINGDGRLDLLISSPTNADVTAAYGFGDGRFWMPHYHDISSSGSDIAAGDINGDAFPDAVVVSSSNVLTVLLGSAVGFTRHTTVSTSLDAGGTTPRGVALADLTGDGELDAVSANEGSDDVVIFVGDGSGDFVATTKLSTLVGAEGDAPFDVAVADITGNGNLDIVTANQTSDDVAVFEGLGGGSFAAPQIFTTRFGNGGQRPLAIAIADVTNDGKPDVLTANRDSDDVSVLANDGAGGLAPPLTFLTLSSANGDGPQGLAVADVTGDAIPDIVTANTSGDVAILPGLGAGVAFGAAQIHEVADADGGGNTPEDVVVADLDGDGTADIITVNVSSSDASVLLGTGGGEFGDAKNFEVGVGDTTISPRALAAGDFNGDGDGDIAVAGNSRAVVVAGLGDGRLAPTQSAPFGVSGLSVLGDMDNNGTLDLIAPRDTLVAVGLQRASGEFSQLTSGSGSSANICTAVGDFDGDTFPDAAAIDSPNSRVNVYLNNGAGGLGSVIQNLTLSGALHVVVADVTGDSVADIVAAAGNSDAVGIATGSGTGTFGAFTQLSTAVAASGQTPRFVQVDDLNGDAKPDIFSANRDSNDVSVILGEGSGSFADATIVPAVFGATAAQPSAVRAGDFNGDGNLDLAVSNAARSTVSILMGFGDGGFAAPQTFDVGTEPLGLAVGDFDGDGLDDVATADLTDSTITVRLGQGHP